MDEPTRSDRLERVDAAMGGRLRERVEQLRTPPPSGWRPIAEVITAEAGIYVGYETVRTWARQHGWHVNDSDELAS